MAKDIKKENKKNPKPNADDKIDSDSALINASKDLQPKDIEKLIENAPKELRSILAKSVIRESTFSGPIPPPEYLEKYELILPGFAERTLKMAEKAQDSAIADGKHERDYGSRGQLFGFIAFLFLILATVFMGAIGQTVLAGLFFTASALGVISLFINGRLQSQNTKNVEDE